MKKLLIREDKSGFYHLEKFGLEFTGTKGQDTFDLQIESKSKSIQLEFPRVTVFDLFAKFDFQLPEVKTNSFLFPHFVRIRQEGTEILVEARTGTLYDLFKERAASQNCQLRAPLPISFYWNGISDREAA
jgi:hypothetical protein